MFNDWDTYEKLQKQLHRYQRKNKSMLIDDIIVGASKIFSSDEENDLTGIWMKAFTGEPTKEEDKPD